MQQNKLVYQVNVLNVKRSQTYRKNKNEPPPIMLKKKKKRKKEKKRDIMVAFVKFVFLEFFFYQTLCFLVLV